MNCIIIDDEKLARTIIRTLCDEIDFLDVVEEFPNAMQAIKYLNENEVDLIFLDIHNQAMERKTSETTNTDSLENDFYINIDRRLIKIDIPSIYLVEAKGDYIHIKTEEKNYTVQLPESLFLKIHRSYIINVKKIIDIEDNSVLIKKDVIPVSRSKRPELMKRLDLL